MKDYITTLGTRIIDTIFNFKENFNIVNSKELFFWKMELDDQPIFRYLYRNFKPVRHLEFGTWQGEGVAYCLEECDATVWTINLPFGEKTIDGKNVYGYYSEDLKSLELWSKKIGLVVQDHCYTDNLGFVGWKYLDKNYGNRVCQIYCDSREWDTRNYPESFFDSVLIDGGHHKDIVINDTLKALPLLRSGGIMMWHDYCPPVYEKFECVRGVMDGIKGIELELKKYFNKLYWINPSWILFGIKK